MLIKHLGTVRLSRSIGMFDEASILAIGEDIVVADVLRSGRFRSQGRVRVQICAPAAASSF